MNKSNVILASKSAIRKEQFINENITFEIIVSGVDETTDNSLSFRNQLADISKRKAMNVFNKTSDRGLRVIIGADQNIVFNNKMYQKPKDINEAREFISSILGSDNVYSYVGNTVLLANKNRILQCINATDVARLKIDNISTEELENYLEKGECLSFCCGINISKCDFIHLEEGRMSTAIGTTLEYAKEMMKNLED